MKKVTSIFDKLDLSGMIHYQVTESDRKTEEILKRVDELSKRLEKVLKEDESNDE